jgi:hypothetical protein
MGIGVLDVQKLSKRYMLDVMHVEQNISDNLLKHMSGEKDTLNTRGVMEEASIHPWLWLQRRGQHFLKLAAPYVFIANENRQFLEGMLLLSKNML